MEEKRTRGHYIDNLQPGNIIAFRIQEDMFSGKVIEINDFDVVVKTKNGSVYNPTKDDIAWIKNGSHWPVGIFKALKYSRNK